MYHAAKGYMPEQGDIIFINFNPSVGCEIQKRRTAIVISDDDYHKATGFVAFCPITSTKREQFIRLDETHKTHGYINATQVKTFDFTDKRREVSFVEKATLEELGETAQLVSMIFNFSELLSE